MTQNNSISMKTVVETYIIEETKELVLDGEKLTEWSSLIDNLELKGQRAITKKDKSPIPFLFMKGTMIATFETLCPKIVDIKDYDKSPIPLEILKLVSLSVNEGYFDKIQVWYDDKTPDPAVMGLKYNEESNRWSNMAYRNHDIFLIGRWADVKMSLTQLAMKAKMICKKSMVASYKNSINSMENAIKEIDSAMDAKFGYDQQTDNDLINQALSAPTIIDDQLPF